MLSALFRPPSNTTLPLCSNVFASLKPRSASISRSALIAIMFFPPTLMPRKSAMYDAMRTSYRTRRSRSTGTASTRLTFALPTRTRVAALARVAHALEIVVPAARRKRRERPRALDRRRRWRLRLRRRLRSRLLQRRQLRHRLPFALPSLLPTLLRSAQRASIRLREHVVRHGLHRAASRQGRSRHDRVAR